MLQMVHGYGGRLNIADDGTVSVYFAERAVTGCPAEVSIGQVLPQLLALQPGEDLPLASDCLDAIFAKDMPAKTTVGPGEVALYFLSTYRHPTNMVIISQERLRQVVTGHATHA